MLNDNSNALRRALLVLLGQIILGTGVALVIKGNLGLDPSAVFIEGVSNVIHKSYGTAALLCNGIILLIVYFLDKFKVNFASISGMFFVGYTVDIVNYILNNLLKLELSSYITMGLFTVIGGLVIALGAVIYISQNLGVAAFDVFPEIIADRTKYKYSTIRRIIDILFLIVGVILGGTFGVGTVYLALAIGPQISLWRNVLKIK